MPPPQTEPEEEHVMYTPIRTFIDSLTEDLASYVTRLPVQAFTPEQLAALLTISDHWHQRQPEPEHRAPVAPSVTYQTDEDRHGTPKRDLGIGNGVCLSDLAEGAVRGLEGFVPTEGDVFDSKEVRVIG